MGPRAGKQPSRIAGIDLARFLAVAGMLAVHVGPTALTDPAGRVYAERTHGRASILFGLLAGIGVSLLAESRSATLSETRIRLLWQATLLLPLGLWLQSLDVTILVILSHYALLFALGAICVGLRTRLLAGLAAATVALGPVLFQLGRHLAPATFNRAPAEWGASPPSAQADPSQLIAHLGLTPDQAATLTPSEIAAMKFNRDSGADNQQSVRSAPPVIATRAFLPTWQDDGN
jgi:hypothetical protein